MDSFFCIDDGVSEVSIDNHSFPSMKKCKFQHMKNKTRCMVCSKCQQCFLLSNEFRKGLD